MLHDFFEWLRKRKVLAWDQIPEFPEVHFELGFRKTVSKEIQRKIIEEIRLISEEINPRIYIAVKWLATYISVRPGELVRLKEGDINKEAGLFIIPHPKEKKLKIVPLIQKDVELLRSFPASLPEIPFFRHLNGHGGATPGSGFGPRYLWKWWTKACENLGIEGVDLYAGTRHSSAMDLKRQFSPEQIKKATGHSTNEAFERYFRTEIEDIRLIYEFAGKTLNGH